MTLEIIKGDLFDHDHQVILHICNCMGAAGKGFVLPLQENFPDWFESYETYCIAKGQSWKFLKGNCQLVETGKGSRIANIFAMPQFHQFNHYEFSRALINLKWQMHDAGLWEVSTPAWPGCGLANGNIEVVKTILEDWSKSTDINVKVYEL